MSDRNAAGLYFKISGYKPEEVDDMVYRQKQIGQTLRQQKERRRAEKKRLNRWKFLWPEYHRSNMKERKVISELPQKKAKSERLKEQIQYGYDLAAWWGLQHD